MLLEDDNIKTKLVEAWRGVGDKPSTPRDWA
jgi:hypothetical protein